MRVAIVVFGVFAHCVTSSVVWGHGCSIGQIPFYGTSQECPVLTPSPVGSLSPADIPATDLDIQLTGGGTAKARANLGVAYVQFSATEQKVWFGLDKLNEPASQGHAAIYYNRRFRVTSSSPWMWEYSVSPELFRFPDIGSGGATSVLFSSTPIFRDKRTERYYSYLMYMVFQDKECDGFEGGFVTLAFSEDGICWTTPVAAQYPHDTPCHQCRFASYQAVSTITFTAMYDSATNTIRLVGVEGDIAILRTLENMNSTFTYVATASPSDPATVALERPAPGQPAFQVSNAGMFNPILPGGAAPRFETYHYMINVNVSFDPVTGQIFISRAYPYGLDRNEVVNPDLQDVIPCGAQNQPGDLVHCKFLPNRIQFYGMDIGPMSDINEIISGTWILNADIGNDTGFSDALDGTCDPTPLQYPQLDFGYDPGMACFVQNPEGSLARDPDTGKAMILAGDSYKKNRSGTGACEVTGDEGMHLIYFSP